MNTNLIQRVEHITEVLPNGIIVELVKVAGNTFLMGGDKEKREEPVHKVDVSDFYIGKTQVTNIQFAAFINDYGSEKVNQGQYSGQQMIYEHEWGIQKTGNKWLPSEGYKHHPVIEATWNGANEYCTWLNELTGKPYHLPSEAQWEYSARGGQQSHGFRYSGGNKLKDVGWYRSNSHHETKPVGLKLPNELGIHDMSGNVWEWCADHWHEDYKKAPDNGSAWITGGDPERGVVRGGSWDNHDNYCRVSDRFGYDAYSRYFNIGFRVARY